MWQWHYKKTIVAMKGIVKKDTLVGNFHLVELFKQVKDYLPNCVNYCSYNITTMLMNMIFLTQWKNKIYKGKNVMMLCVLHIISQPHVLLGLMCKVESHWIKIMCYMSMSLWKILDLYLIVLDENHFYPCIQKINWLIKSYSNLWIIFFILIWNFIIFQ